MTIDSYFDSYFQGIHTAESKLQVTERWKLLNEREVKDTIRNISFLLANRFKFLQSCLLRLGESKSCPISFVKL